MKTFKVGVTYESWGVLEVQAESLEDLKKKLKDEDFLEEMPLPQEPEYVEESYKIDEEFEIEEIEEIKIGN